ncbi:hypothetical protein NBRC116602_23990 [Hyphomicrobiales bacterium 4NK60-0047b]
MKIIALFPVRNEEWILPTYLSSVSQIADEIIALDQESEDSTEKILKEKNVRVEKNIVPKGTWQQTNIRREKLLSLGRASGGTHFIWLDADEAFTANFLKQGRDIIGNLKPGQKLTMQWLALWKSIDKYRDDESVWSNNFKDFIVCDHPDYGFEVAHIHEGRTQGPNTTDTLVQLPLEKGAVLHFQFVPWQKFQLKQAWYRCLELIDAPNAAESINATYSITLDDPKVGLQKIPEDWTNDLQIDPLITQNSSSWHLNEIIKLFNKHGIEFFEPLQIWHLDELNCEFEKRLGRPPKKNMYRHNMRIWSRLKGSILRRVNR